MSAQLVSSIGLFIDILGAFWIVKSLLWVSDDELARASDQGGVWSGGVAPTPQPELVAMFKSSRRDARIGLALLVIGFALQIVGTWLP